MKARRRFASTQQLVTLRPEAVAPDLDVLRDPSTAAQQARLRSIVGTNAALFLGTSDGAVRAFLFDSGNWLRNAAWGAGAGSVTIGDTSVRAVRVSHVVVGINQAPWSVCTRPTDGTLVANAPDGGVQSDPGGPSLSSSGVLFADGASPAPAIFAAKTDLTDPVRVPLTGAGSVSTIALGSAGLRYLLTLDGHLEAHLPCRSRSTGQRGSTRLPSRPLPRSTALRDAGVPSPSATGVLYAASTGGNLFAVVVDDPGLDTTAPWPKYQHDVRNTGNPGTVLRSCP